MPGIVLTGDHYDNGSRENTCCGQCAWHRHTDWDGAEDGYVCVNSDSDSYGEYTKYDYVCSDFEPRF